MKDLTNADKELLQTALRKEFDSIPINSLDYDNARYLQIIEISEKLYLGNEFIKQMKNDLI